MLVAVQGLPSLRACSEAGVWRKRGAGLGKEGSQHGKGSAEQFHHTEGGREVPPEFLGHRPVQPSGTGQTSRLGVSPGRPGGCRHPPPGGTRQGGLRRSPQGPLPDPQPGGPTPPALKQRGGPRESSGRQAEEKRREAGGGGPPPHGCYPLPAWRSHLVSPSSPPTPRRWFHLPPPPTPPFSDRGRGVSGPARDSPPASSIFMSASREVPE